MPSQRSLILPDAAAQEVYRATYQTCCPRASHKPLAWSARFEKTKLKNNNNKSTSLSPTRQIALRGKESTHAPTRRGTAHPDADPKAWVQRGAFPISSLNNLKLFTDSNYPQIPYPYPFWPLSLYPIYLFNLTRPL